MYIQVLKKLQFVSRGFAYTLVLCGVLLFSATETNNIGTDPTYEVVDFDGDEERSDKEQEEDKPQKENHTVISMNNSSTFYTFSCLQIRMSFPSYLLTVTQDIPSPPPDRA
tara:strand:+ start:2571 stop:2903 length:333 start_codon:yes stop_codon:yes gene_type:complete